MPGTAVRERWAMENRWQQQQRAAACCLPASTVFFQRRQHDCPPPLQHSVPPTTFQHTHTHTHTHTNAPRPHVRQDQLAWPRRVGPSWRPPRARGGPRRVRHPRGTQQGASSDLLPPPPSFPRPDTTAERHRPSCSHPATTLDVWQPLSIVTHPSSYPPPPPATPRAGRRGDGHPAAQRAPRRGRECVVQRRRRASLPRVVHAWQGAARCRAACFGANQMCGVDVGRARRARIGAVRAPLSAAAAAARPRLAAQPSQRRAVRMLMTMMTIGGLFSFWRGVGPAAWCCQPRACARGAAPDRPRRRRLACASISRLLLRARARATGCRRRRYRRCRRSRCTGSARPSACFLIGCASSSAPLHG